MQKTILKNYAKLLARSGLNVQKGQDVIVTADIAQAEFVLLVAEECYRAGARRVFPEWTYQSLTRMQAQERSLEQLSRVLPWEEEGLRRQSKTLPAHLYIMSEDPDGMHGIDAEKYAAAMQARSAIIKPYRDERENKDQWCIAAAAGEAWAKKVFPREKSAAGALEKLWRAIISSSRANGNPIANWAAHNKDLSARCAFLNGLGLAALEYRSSNGTDFRVGLMREGIFAGGEETTLSGIPFNPNIPSEEVYTSPKRGEAEGIVYSSKPLSYQGQLIRNFSIRFEGGRAVEAHASQGESVLKKMLAMDEGASYLGECALVPYNSPISNAKMLFYNTLFDENAACHLALGRGFSNCVRDYAQYSEEQIKALGVNDSMIHVDFMIGTDDLEIVGITQTGARIAIFKEGNWAFEVQ